MPFDELLLDDADLLAARDAGRLLWALATAGAQVRRCVELRDDWGLGRLATGDLPRAVLVSADAPAKGAARVIVRMSSGAAPTLSWGGVELPRWAGPADALLVGSTDGRNPRLARLAELAEHRGMAVAVVAPAGSPVAQAAGRAPVCELGPDLHMRAARWSVLTPFLQAADALGLLNAPSGLLGEVADALDGTAESCRPASESFTNAAKSLAIELADSVPVVAGAGTLAGVAARLISEAIQLLAGVGAVSVGLPDGVAFAGALLRGGPTDRVADDDLSGFFADRDAYAPPRPRLITVGDDGAPDDPELGERTDAEVQLDEVAARQAVAALRAIATQRGLRWSHVDAPDGPALVRFAAATAFGDFAATYLAFGLGIDPCERLPGELT